MSIIPLSQCFGCLHARRRAIRLRESHLTIFSTCVQAIRKNSSCFGCLEDGKTKDFERGAAILIIHKTTLPLLVPRPFDAKIRPFGRPV